MSMDIWNLAQSRRITPRTSDFYILHVYGLDWIDPHTLLEPSIQGIASGSDEPTKRSFSKTTWFPFPGETHLRVIRDIMRRKDDAFS